jgi:hypothetical protein
MILRLMDYSFSRLRKFGSSLVYDRFRWFLLPTGPQSVPEFFMHGSGPATKSAALEREAVTAGGT